MVDGNGQGAATFFLAEGHRHLPNANKLDHKHHKKKHQSLRDQKYGKKKKGGDDDYESQSDRQRKEDEENAKQEGKLLPKQELIKGLEKCNVVDPIGLATTLFNGNQVTYEHLYRIYLLLNDVSSA